MKPLIKFKEEINDSLKKKDKPISKSHKKEKPTILDATWKIGSWYYTGKKK